MVTAQLYSQIDPFERLSKPLNELLPQVEAQLQEEELQNNGPIVEILDETGQHKNLYRTELAPISEDKCESPNNALASFGQELNFPGGTLNQQHQRNTGFFENDYDLEQQREYEMRL